MPSRKDVITIKSKQLQQKIVDNFSYKKQFLKKVKELHIRKKKYLELSDDEFLLSYIEVNSTYEKKKMIFSIVFVSLIISILTNSWKYCFQFLLKIIQSNNNMVVSMSKEINLFIIFLELVIIIVIFIVLFSMIKNIYKISQEKLLLEEIKKIRDEDKNE